MIRLACDISPDDSGQQIARRRMLSLILAEDLAIALKQRNARGVHSRYEWRSDGTGRSFK